MQIRLEHKGKEFIIETDDTQYIVSRGLKDMIDSKTKEKRIRRVRPAFFGDISIAIQYVVDGFIKHSDATTLKELKDDITEIKQYLYNNLNNIL